ncbi:uncharacterized protein CTRU02_210843 [Colletotrichum truncatum]|uniref:Uncharacterized protein n=1 Tax=Colletotrichum truncatum TaxID=5467 RepID=A0ACC3YQ47_COLTU
MAILLSSDRHLRLFQRRLLSYHLRMGSLATARRRKQVPEEGHYQGVSPSTQPSPSLITTTITRTTIFEVAGETRVVVSPLFQTLTFTNPTLVTETSTITVSQRSRNFDKREVVGSVTTNQKAISSTESSHLWKVVPASETTTLRPHFSGASRRHTSNDVMAVTVAGQMSTITIELTVTLTRTGTFVSTATIFNPVFVSTTATPTMTITSFVTTTISITTAASRTSDLSSIAEILPSQGSTSATAIASLTTPTSSRSPVGPSTEVSTISSSASSAPETTVDATTWFSTEPEGSTATGRSLTSTETMVSTRRTPSSTSLPPAPEFSSQPALGPGEIAGVTLGAVSGIALIILIIWLLRRRSKRRQHVHIPDDDYQMTPTETAAAIINSSPLAMDLHDRSRALPSNASGNSSRDGDVRIVIQPMAKRRTQSSSLFPSPKTWPRPPGYTGQAYSFSAGESGDSTPRDPTTWSNASEYGSSGNRDGLLDGGPLNMNGTGGEGHQRAPYVRMGQESERRKGSGL